MILYNYHICGFGGENYRNIGYYKEGICHFKENQITSDKLPDEFYQWTKGVKYLPSRILLKDIFEVKTIYKQVAIEEFDDQYYKKLKKSLPEKIKNGEVEWLYSYGDKLIANGYKSVFDVDAMYARCCELYEKYKNKKFWFSWFK